MRQIVVVSADEAFGHEIAVALGSLGDGVVANSGIDEAARRVDEGSIDAILLLEDDFATAEIAALAMRVDATRKHGARIHFVSLCDSPDAMPPAGATLRRLPMRCGLPLLATALGHGEQPGTHALDDLVLGGEAAHTTRRADALARSDAATLIVGEPGTGRTTLARRLHARSGRDGALIEIDCESACARRFPDLPFRGCSASDSLLLEHVDALAPELQAALLERLEAFDGVEAPRLIATSARALVSAVRRVDTPFLPALAYRLEAVPLTLPPLRERAADLEALAMRFLETAARQAGLPSPTLDRDGLAELAQHAFPGNLTELQSLMQRAATLFAGERVPIAGLIAGRTSATRAARFVAPSLNLREIERIAIEHALIEERGNRSRAAAQLGISARTLRNKIRDYGFQETGRTI